MMYGCGGLYVYRETGCRAYEKEACFWISRNREDESWPTDIEIRKLCTDTYPCEIVAYSVDTWGMQDTMRVVTIETE